MSGFHCAVVVHVRAVSDARSLEVQDECKALMQQETTRTRDLEAQIAVAEARPSSYACHRN